MSGAKLEVVCPVQSSRSTDWAMLEETGVCGAGGEQLRCTAGVHFSLQVSKRMQTRRERQCRSRAAAGTGLTATEAESFQSMLPFFHCADFIPHDSVTACHSNFGINVRHLGVRVGLG